MTKRHQFRAVVAVPSPEPAAARRRPDTTAGRGSAVAGDRHQWGAGVAVTRYGEARAVLADRRFGLALPGVETVGDQTNDALFQDPAGHTRLRKLVSAAFTPRRVAELRPRIAELAAGLVDQMTARRPPVDLMEAVGFPLPIMVIGELLGVPTAERENFRAWSNALLSLPSTGGNDPGTGWGNLSAQVSDLIGRKRAHPGDNLLSALIAVRDTDADHSARPSWS